ncbi:MAG TPA: pyridoxamine 5'-phosphate oxidase family protein [Gaiellaceae bacterium]|nr:pyridoxamine 5'-phosphate oxidase family protein [Gaiellaceae bacterium]
MTQTLLNRTTATKENALTDAERDAFLTELRIGRLASQRADGWPHVTPIWYVWEGGRFVMSLGKSRRHLRNIARDPHVTLCVDEDPRTTDLTKAPRSVVCFGLAELFEDEETVRDVTSKVEQRYLPAEARGPELDELLWFEGRTAVVITPQRWLAWDQGKG